MLLQLMDLGPLGPILLVDVDLMVVGAKSDLWSTKTLFRILSINRKCDADE